MRAVGPDRRNTDWILVGLIGLLSRVQGVSLVDTGNSNNIAIVGAGVADLSTAKQLIDSAYKVSADKTLLRGINMLGFTTTYMSVSTIIPAFFMPSRKWSWSLTFLNLYTRFQNSCQFFCCGSASTIWAICRPIRAASPARPICA